MPQEGSPTLSQIRRDYREYDNMNDSELAEALYLKYQPNEDFDVFSRGIGFDEEAQTARFSPKELNQRKQNLEEKSSLHRGFYGGVEKTKALGAGALAAVGSAMEETVGVGESLRDWGISEYKENMREAQIKYPQKTSFQELIDDPSVSGALDWGAYTLGDLAPTIAATFATGGAGGLMAGTARAAGKRALSYMSRKVGTEAIEKGIRNAERKLINRQLAKGIAEDVAQKMTTRGLGAQAGMVAGSGALETGGMYGEAVEELGREEANPFTALTLGAAAGAVELAGGNIRVLRKIFGDQIDDGVKSAIELAKRDAKARPAAIRFLSRVVGEAARQAPAEMGQEAVQEALAITNMNFQDPDAESILSRENAWRIIEAGAAGGLAGGVFGGAGTATTEAAQNAGVMQGAGRAKDQIDELSQRIGRQKALRERLPESQRAEVDKRIQENEQKVADLQNKVLAKQKGKISYEEAAKRLSSEAPKPDGKKTTLKTVRKLVKNDRVSGDQFGVDEAALMKHIEARQQEQAKELQKQGLDQLDTSKSYFDQAGDLVGFADQQQELNQDTIDRGQELVGSLKTEYESLLDQGKKKEAEQLRARAKELSDRVGIPVHLQKAKEEKPTQRAQTEEQPLDEFESAPDLTGQNVAFSLSDDLVPVSEAGEKIAQIQAQDPFQAKSRAKIQIDTAWQHTGENVTEDEFAAAMGSVISNRAYFTDEPNKVTQAGLSALSEWKAERQSAKHTFPAPSITDPRQQASGRALEDMDAGTRAAYLTSGYDFLLNSVDKEGNMLADKFLPERLGVDAETVREIAELEKQRLLEEQGVWDDSFQETLRTSMSEKWTRQEKNKLATDLVGRLRQAVQAFEEVKKTSENPRQDYIEMHREFDRVAVKSGSRAAMEPSEELDRLRADYIKTRAELIEAEKETTKGEASSREEAKLQNIRNRLFSILFESLDDKYFRPEVRPLKRAVVGPKETMRERNTEQGIHPRTKNARGEELSKEQKQAEKKRADYQAFRAAQALASRMIELKLDFRRQGKDPEAQVQKFQGGRVVIEQHQDAEDRQTDLNRLTQDIVPLFKEDVFGVDDYQHVVGVPEYMGAIYHQFIDRKALEQNKLHPHYARLVDSAVEKIEDIYKRSNGGENREVLKEFQDVLSPYLTDVASNNLALAISSKVLHHQDQNLASAYKHALKNLFSKSFGQDPKAKIPRTQFNAQKHITDASALKLDFGKHVTPLDPTRFSPLLRKTRTEQYKAGEIEHIFQTDPVFQEQYREQEILDAMRRNNFLVGANDKAISMDDRVRQELARGIAKSQVKKVYTGNKSAARKEVDEQTAPEAPVGTIPAPVAQLIVDQMSSIDEQLANEHESVEQSATDALNKLLSPETLRMVKSHAPYSGEAKEQLDFVYDLLGKLFKQYGMRVQTRPETLREGADSSNLKARVTDKQVGNKYVGVAHLKYDGDIVSFEKDGEKYVVTGFVRDEKSGEAEQKRLEELDENNPEHWAELAELERMRPASRIQLLSLKTGKTETVAEGTQLVKHPRVDHYLYFGPSDRGMGELRNFFEQAIKRYYQSHAEASRKQAVPKTHARIVTDEDGKKFLRLFPDRNSPVFEDYEVTPGESAQLEKVNEVRRALEEMRSGLRETPQISDYGIRELLDAYANLEEATYAQEMADTATFSGGPSMDEREDVEHFEDQMKRAADVSADVSGEGPDASGDVTVDSMRAPATEKQAERERSAELEENRQAKIINYLTDDSTFDFGTMADELKELAKDMPAERKTGVLAVAREFEKHRGEAGTKEEVNAAERTARIKQMLLESESLSREDKEKVQARYAEKGDKAGNALGLEMLIESQFRAKDRKELDKLRAEGREKERREEVQRLLTQQLTKGPTTPEYTTIEPEKLEQAILSVVADDSLTAEEKENLVMFRDPEEYGDLSGLSQLEEKGFRFRIHLPKEMQEFRPGGGDVRKYAWVKPSELSRFKDKDGNLPQVAGFQHVMTFKDPDKEGETIRKPYIFQVTDKQRLTPQEEERFTKGYRFHVPKSAMYSPETEGVKREFGLQVQIGGEWYHVVPDDTVTRDLDEEQLRLASRQRFDQEKKTWENVERAGRHFPWPADSYWMGFSLEEEDVARVDLTEEVNRDNLSRQLNNISERLVHGSRNVHLHLTPYDETVPKEVREQLFKEGVDHRVKGLYNYQTNAVHIFLNRHADKEGKLDKRSLTKTLLHEAALHGGLTNIFEGDQEFEAFMHDVHRAYKNELPDPETMTRAKFLRTIEEFLARKVEQTEVDAKGRFVNPEINTWYDKLAAFVVKAARKIATQLGMTIHLTKPEIRETIGKTFRGLDVKRTHGLAHMIPGDMKPARNVPRYKEFQTYEENRGDWFLRKIEDAQRQWLLLKKSMFNQGIKLRDDEDVETHLRLYPGRVEPNEKLVRDRMQNAYDKIAKHRLSIEEVTKYLFAKHALERNARIRNSPKIQKRVRSQAEIDLQNAGSGIHDETAKQWLSELEKAGKTNAVHEVAQEVWKTNEEFLDNLVLYGFKTQKEVDRIRKTFDYFVPMGHEDFFEKAVESSGMAGSSNLVKGLKPNLEPGLNPLAMTFNRAQNAVANGEKNLVKQSLYHMIYNHPQSNLFELYLPEEEVRQLQADMNLSDADMTDWLMERGFHSQADIADSLQDELRNNRIVPVTIDGKRSYIRIKHEGLRRAFLQEGIVRGKGLVRALGGLSRWLVMANTMFNPEFWYTNLLRDVGTAVGNTITMQRLGKNQDTKQLAKQVLKGVPHAMRGIANYNFGKGDHEFAAIFKDYVEHGGKIGAPFHGNKDMTELVQEMQREIDRRGSGGIAAVMLRHKDKLMDLTTRINDVFENASRVSAYKTAIDNGVSKVQAAKMARELTVDFNRKGELGQLMNTFYLFSTAGVGGTARILRGLVKNPQRAGKLIGGIALGGASLALMNRLAGGTDEDGRWHFERINRDTRSRHMIFMVPGGNGDYMKIPLPYGFGFFFDLGQLMVDYALSERGHGTFDTAGQILGSATHNFNPISAAGKLNTAHGWLQLVSPTLADPMVDISMEKTPFGSPLMPTPEYKGQPDASRHWDSVGVVSREASQLLNELTGGAPEVPGAVDISPETMDYMLETFGGSAGRFWMQRLPGYITGKLQGKQMDYNDVPALRRVMGEPYDWQNRQLFNEAVYEVQSAGDRLDNMRKRAQYAKTESARQSAMETIRNYQKDNRKLLALDGLRKDMFARIKDIDTRKERIRKSGYSQSQKDKALNNLDERQYKFMKQFNNRFLQSTD